jgi:hypothetical protein
LHASVRKALRQAWELDDAEKAEKLTRNLAPRLEREAPGVSASILEESTRSSPSPASACRSNCAGRWRARTSSKT